VRCRARPSLLRWPGVPPVPLAEAPRAHLSKHDGLFSAAAASPRGAALQSNAASGSTCIDSRTAGAKQVSAGRATTTGPRPTGKRSGRSSWRLLAHKSDSAGVLAGRRESGDWQAPSRPPSRRRRRTRVHGKAQLRADRQPRPERRRRGVPRLATCRRVTTRGSRPGFAPARVSRLSLLAERISGPRRVCSSKMGRSTGPLGCCRPTSARVGRFGAAGCRAVSALLLS
jgi:hypothetical protein